MLVKARVLLPFVAVMISAGAAHAGSSVRTGREPGWVETVALPDVDAPPSAAGVYYLLTDDQDRFGHTVERYEHVAVRLLSTEGIGDVSDLSIGFEPSYQHLTFHYVRVLRDGVVRNVLDPRAITIAHVENDADARMYDGRVEATFHIPDVRVGDVVEWAFTVTGWNPVLRGQVLDTLPLAFDVPIERLRERLLVEHGRALALQKVGTALEPSRRRVGNWDEYAVNLRAVASRDLDGQTPGSYDPGPAIRFSSFFGWNQVARWAAKTYRGATRADDRVRAVAERIAAEHTDPRARLRAAARFVQDEVRYVGIEIDQGSHRPRPASAVIEHRFGDCKDKSVLLVSLLSVLGIDAVPALVSSYRGRALEQWVPSPYAFDHVIVRVALSPNDVVWIDPTISQQRGKRFEALPYRLALPVDPEIHGLAPMPAPKLNGPSIRITEHFDVPDRAEGIATLTVETHYLGTDAEVLRRRLASQSHAEISKAYVNYYAKQFSRIEADGEPRFDDRPDANEIVVHERYRIPHFWSDGEFEYYEQDASGLVQAPSRVQRSAPFRLRDPVWVRHTIELRLPPWVHFDPLDHEVDNPYFRYTVDSEQVGSVETIHYSLRTKSNQVPAAQMDGYVAARDEVFDHNGFRMTLGKKPGRAFAMKLRLTVGRVLVVVGVVGGLILFIVWSNRRTPRPLGAPVPATALPAPPSGSARSLEPPSNGQATAALWLGLSANFVILIPFVNAIVGILAIIFGAYGLRRARVLDGYGRGNALAGIWLGLFALLFSAAVIYSVVVQGKMPLSD